MFRRHPTWRKLPLKEIVKRAKIVVIDDDEFPYQKLFKRDGYSIEKWPDVKDVSRLEEGDFDVILLDLFGVGKAQSERQGFGILEHIRERRPAQIVVAYSNAEWSVEYQPFFQDADAVLHKTKDDYYEFKRTVDDLLQQRFSFGFYAARVRDELGDSADLIPKLDRRVSRAVASGNTAPLRHTLLERVEDKITVDRVIAVVEIAIEIGKQLA
jgi:CheY-like chemotaxis protein